MASYTEWDLQEVGGLFSSGSIGNNNKLGIG